MIAIAGVALITRSMSDWWWFTGLLSVILS